MDPQGPTESPRKDPPEVRGKPVPLTEITASIFVLRFSGTMGTLIMRAQRLPASFSRADQLMVTLDLHGLIRDASQSENR